MPSNASKGLVAAGIIGALSAAGYLAYRTLPDLIKRNTASQAAAAAAPKKRVIKAVLFDMDGTLLDTAEIWFELLRACVAHLGYPELKYWHWQQFFGQSMQRNVAEFMPGASQEVVDKYCEVNYGKYIDKLEILRGSEAAVLALGARTGDRICIVTNCPRPMFLETLSAPAASKLHEAFGGERSPDGTQFDHSGLFAVCADDWLDGNERVHGTRRPPAVFSPRVEAGGEGKQGAAGAATPDSASASSASAAAAAAAASSSAAAAAAGSGNKSQERKQEDAGAAAGAAAGATAGATGSGVESAPGGPKTPVKVLPKPDTMMLLEAARRLRVPIENCLMVGDSKFDMMAGRAAGCFTVGVGGKAEGGHVHVDSVADILKLGELIEFSDA